MSDYEAALRKWRDQGSLRYLARKLGVTPKQVTRYSDNGWIDGSYRTPKGHRRIRYADSTVENVALMVRQEKGMECPDPLPPSANRLSWHHHPGKGLQLGARPLQESPEGGIKQARGSRRGIYP